MYCATLNRYLAAYADEGTPVASVDMWPACDVGDESKLGITITRGQAEPIWLMYDSGGGLVERINVGGV
jgi:hypothetical protein